MHRFLRGLQASTKNDLSSPASNLSMPARAPIIRKGRCIDPSEFLFDPCEGFIDTCDGFGPPQRLIYRLLRWIYRPLRGFQTAFEQDLSPPPSVMSSRGRSIDNYNGFKPPSRPPPKTSEPDLSPLPSENELPSQIYRKLHWFQATKTLAKSQNHRHNYKNID